MANNLNKKIVVDKDFIKGYESLEIGFENCEVYEISVNDILDIYYVASFEEGVYYKEHVTDDGFVKISACCKNKLSVSHESYGEDEGKLTLQERLTSWNDVTSLTLIGKGKKNFFVWIPYDPLCSEAYDEVIEYTNCCSFETLNNGDMVLCFGKSSKTPTRKDNDYINLVNGWKEKYGSFMPESLSVKVDEMHQFYDDNDFLYLPFEIKNRKVANKMGELEFSYIDKVAINMRFPLDGNIKIHISKVLDGRLFVVLEGIGIEFYCKEISLLDEYC